jgi:hypothetical protein
MRKPLTAVLVALLTILVRAAPAEPDFSAARYKAHVTFLADDLLEGREAGTRGHELAARYIASQFELLDVRPGGRAGSYFDPVTLIEATATGAPPAVVVTTPSGVRRLEQKRDAGIVGPLAGGTARVDAPLVFVGYGMEDAAMGFDDYQGLDVRGKIAVALFGSPKAIDSEIGAHLTTQQRRVAAAHGAVGMMLIPTRLMSAAFPWDKLCEIASEPAIGWVQTDGTPAGRAAGLTPFAFIDPATAGDLFEASGTSLAQILDEADKDRGRPKGLPLKASAVLSITTSARRFTSPEVIGVIDGADPALKTEYVALMAHADHIGVTANGGGDRINNGALDNAAGVATLLEVARAFATSAERPRRSILLIANTAEEKGLLGAEYFARNPTVPAARITAAIDLDMPMLLYDFTDVVAYGATHSTLQGVVDRAAGSMNVKLSPDPMPEQAVFVRSDHYPMVKAGIPAVMLATGMANGGAAAWGRFLSRNYHQPSDDVTQPILWQAGAKFAELNYRIVRSLADADTPPRWYENDYFGNVFAPHAAKAPRPGAPR